MRILCGWALLVNTWGLLGRCLCRLQRRRVSACVRGDELPRLCSWVVLCHVQVCRVFELRKLWNWSVPGGDRGVCMLELPIRFLLQCGRCHIFCCLLSV